MISKNKENVYFSNDKPKSPDPLPISVHFVHTSPLCFIGKNRHKNLGLSQQSPGSTPGWHGSIILTTEARNSRFDARSQQPKVVLGIIGHNWLQRAGNDECILTMKPMGRVI